MLGRTVFQPRSLSARKETVVYRPMGATETRGTRFAQPSLDKINLNYFAPSVWLDFRCRRVAPLRAPVRCARLVDHATRAVLLARAPSKVEKIIRSIRGCPGRIAAASTLEGAPLAMTC